MLLEKTNYRPTCISSFPFGFKNTSVFTLCVYACKDRGRLGVGQCAVTACVSCLSQQGKQNWCRHSHINLDKVHILQNVSGRILDNGILCFSEFYKKNEGKSLLFSSKRCKLKWKNAIVYLSHWPRFCQRTVLLRPDGVQDHHHVSCMKGDRHLLSEGTLEAHRGDPDSWSSLTLFLEIYSKDIPAIQARLSSPPCYLWNKKLQTTLMFNCREVVWITAQFSDGMLCNHWKQSSSLISNTRKFKIMTLQQSSVYTII